jgi:hypothetical protein
VSLFVLFLSHAFHLGSLVYEFEMDVPLPSDVLWCCLRYVEIQFHVFHAFALWIFYHSKFLTFHGNLPFNRMLGVHLWCSLNEKSKRIKI